MSLVHKVESQTTREALQFAMAKRSAAMERANSLANQARQAQQQAIVESQNLDTVLARVATELGLDTKDATLSVVGNGDMILLEPKEKKEDGDN